MSRFFLAIALTALCCTAQAGQTVELTGKTLVQGDVVTVGDLFTNTGKHATHVLAPAPAVGEKLTLNKNDLLRVTKAFHLDWTATDDASASLQRDAVAVTKDDIAAALGASDLKDKIASDAKFDIADFDKAIVLDGQDVPELSVSDTSFDPATEKFSATLHISRKGVAVKDITLNGIATAMITVPVLVRSTTSGLVISKADVTEISVPKRDLRSDVIASKDALIGMTPKRSLQAGKPVASSEVTPPLMIKRNELVTVIYSNGPVHLSTKARALGNATTGETVTLMNANSKKPFDAIVTGPQQAEVNVATING